MNAHTPGPWRKGSGNLEDNHIYDQQGRLIALARYVNGSGDRAFVEANARLIAAGPDLYEAARQYSHEAGHAPQCPARDYQDSHCDCGFWMLQQAIAKAEGRAA